MSGKTYLGLMILPFYLFSYSSGNSLGVSLPLKYNHSLLLSQNTLEHQPDSMINMTIMSARDQQNINCLRSGKCDR